MRFCEIGGGVTTQTMMGTKTVSDNPDGVCLTPQLRKAASPLCVMRRQRCGQRIVPKRK